MSHRHLLDKLNLQHTYLLNELPALIPANGTEVALEEATLDQIAFAIITLDNQVRPLSRHLNALRELYDLARRRQALGAHRIQEALANQEVRS